MSDPVARYLQQYGPQAQPQGGSAVDRYLQQYGSAPADTTVAAPLSPPDTRDLFHKAMDIDQQWRIGVEEAIAEAAKGTAGFAADVAAPLREAIRLPDEFFTSRGLPVPQRAEVKPGGQVVSELIKGAVVTPLEGAKEVFTGATAREKAHGATMAVLGGLGLLGIGHEVGKTGKTIADIRSERAAAPAEPIVAKTQEAAGEKATVEGFGAATTPEQRAALVKEQLRKQAEVEAAQKTEKSRVRAAKNTWTTLTPDQRASIVPGLAVKDYAKSWDELSKESRASVRDKFDAQAQANAPAAPAAEAAPVVPPPAEAPPAAEAAPPEPAAAPAPERPLTHGDVTEMGLPELRDELHKAEAKVAELNQEYKKLPPKAKIPKSVEHEHWEKYLADLQEEQALRLKRDPTGGAPKNTFEALDEQMAAEDLAKSKAIDALMAERGKLLDAQKTGAKVDPAKIERLDNAIAKLQHEIAGTEPPEVVGEIRPTEPPGVAELRDKLPDHLKYLADEFADEAAKGQWGKPESNLYKERLADLAKVPEREGGLTPDAAIEQVVRETRQTQRDIILKEIDRLEEHRKLLPNIPKAMFDAQLAKLKAELARLDEPPPEEGGAAATKPPEPEPPFEPPGSWQNAVAETREQGPRLQDQTPEELAAEQLIRETSGRAKDKPMGQLTVEELQQAIADYKKKIAEEGSTPSREDTLEALRETLDEKGGVELPPDPAVIDTELRNFYKDFGKRDLSQLDIEDLQTIHDRLLEIVEDVPGDQTPPRFHELEKHILDAMDKAKQREQGPPSDEELRARDEQLMAEQIPEELEAQRMELEDRLEPVQPLEPGRLEEIEQRADDLTQIEKLLAQTGKIDPETVKIQLEALDATLDHLDSMIDKGLISEAAYEKQLFDIADMKKRLKDLLGPAEPSKGAFAAAGKPYKFKMPDTVGKDLNKFSADQLKNTKAGISALLRDPNVVKTPEANILRQEFDRILDYEAEIRRQSGEGPRGPGLATHKIDVKGEPKAPWEEYMSKKIVTGAHLKQPFNFVKIIRQIYQGVAKPSHALNIADRLYEASTGEKLPTHRQAGKLMEMSDGSVTKAEEFLRGQGPFVPDNLGGTLPTGAKSLADIVVNTARADVERFGWLWAARRAMDLAATKNRSIGIDLAMAQETIINSPQHLHKAVEEGRAYHSGLSLYGLIKGLIKPEARAAFETETAYGPIQRMFGPDEVVSKIAEIVNKSGQSAERVLGQQPFKRLKQSDLLIRNMVESSLDITHRIIRAADMNEIGLALTDHAITKPDVFRGMIERLDHKTHLSMVKDVEARTNAVRAMYKEVGIDISREHANMMANLLSDNALNVEGGILRVWRNGKLELWKVDSLIADSLKSLNPPEMKMWLKVAGFPAKLGRVGIVLDPVFQIGQLVNDQFQGYINSKYGFVPGIDTFVAWKHIMQDSPAFREAVRAGGVEKSSLRGRTSMDELMAGPAVKPGELAFNQIRTGHPVKALQTMLTPVREATRLAEYLKARGRGATPTEAAWAARDLLGNYSMQGTWATMRALNHMSLFLSPAVAVLDKTARVIKDNPAKWAARASTIAVISYLVQMANEGDDEIEQLRQTPGGQRWWFMRVGDEIMKFRKPYFEGAVFGAGMEAAMDYAKNQDPEAFKLWLDGQRNELALNMLPVMGAVPFQVWANKDFHSDAPIIPEGQQQLDPAFQTGYFSGTAERVVGKTVGISPAIISYVVRSTTGYLGESAVKTVSAAVDWANTGELPPVEDLPLTQRLFAKYPSYSVKPVQDYYKLADKVNRAAETINYVQNHSPDDVEMVLTRYEQEIPYIEVFNESRQQIADLRRAIQDVEDLKDLGPASKKLYTDEYLRSIIDITKAVSETVKQMQRDQAAAK